MKKTKYLFIFIFGLLIIPVFLYFSLNKINSQKKYRLSKSESLALYANYEFQRTKDPKTGDLPKNIKERVLNFVKNINSSNQLQLQKTGDYNNGSFFWQNIGPTNVGGRANCIAIDINDEKTLLVGAATGGVWRSTDDGITWVKTTPKNEIQSVYCIAQDKREGKYNTWYYGSGELLSTIDRKISTKARMSYIGDGMFKSTDNGVSWFLLPSTKPSNTTNLSGIFQGIWKIIPDPNINNSDVVYAACVGGIIKSTDGGNSWNLVLGDVNNLAFSSDLEITNDGVLYAAISSISLSGITPKYTGIFKSTNQGNNWENISGSFLPNDAKVIKLAIAPSNNNVLYVSVEEPTNGIDMYSFHDSKSSLYKYTENASQKWQDLTANLFPPSQDIMTYSTLGGYAQNLIVGPNDENFVLLAGTSLYRSKNGFADNLHFDMIGGYYWQDNYFTYDLASWYLHPDVHSLTFSPQNTKTLYTVSDGGVYKLEDVNAVTPEWVSLNQNLITSQFYSVAISQSPYTKLLVGGLQDNGSFYMNASNQTTKDWNELTGGDGMNVAIANDLSYVITTWYNGASVLTTLSESLEPQNFYYITPWSLNSEEFSFYNNFIIDPNDKNSIYLPALNKILFHHKLMDIEQSENIFNSEWVISPPDAFVLPSNDTISVMKIYDDASGFKNLLVGTNNGNLYVIYDADNPNSAVRYNITGANFPRGGWISSIDVNTNNGSDEIYLTFSNYNVQSIFYSKDKGQSWQEIGGNLEEFPDGTGAGPSVRWIKYVPYQQEGLILVGTDVGLFSTTHLQGMQTEWLQEGKETIGNVIVEMIDTYVDNDKITAAIATQGSGVFLSEIPLSVDDNLQRETSILRNYPNPANLSTTIEFSLNQDDFVTMILSDNSGKFIRTLFEGFVEKGLHQLQINMANLYVGSYIYTLKTKKFNITKKMLVVK